MPVALTFAFTYKPNALNIWPYQQYCRCRSCKNLFHPNLTFLMQLTQLWKEQGEFEPGSAIRLKFIIVGFCLRY